jgi:hypothetical protein
MTIAMQPIYTQNVGSAGISGINFNNIPQTFTDLLVKFSIRTAFSSTYQDIPVYFNNSGSNYSLTRIYGTGSAVASNRTNGPGAVAGGEGNSATSTSNTFSSVEIYIPNYTSSFFKQYKVDSVIENNATASFIDLQAGLWSNTAAITTIGISGAGQTIVQYSSATLYGITKG